MIVAESIEPHDCLRVCVASAFEVAAREVPNVPVDEADQSEAMRPLQAWLEPRGYTFDWYELPSSYALAGVLPSTHARLLWVAGVLHPSFPGGYGHALLCRGPDVVVYPPTGRADVPLEQLQLAAVGLFVALDPARLQLAPHLAAIDALLQSVADYLGVREPDDDDALVIRLRGAAAHYAELRGAL